MDNEEIVRQKFTALASCFNERTRRLWAATEANAIGHGGVSLVCRATGISRRAINIGKKEIAAGAQVPEGKTRRPGGGRKSALHHYPELPQKLEALVEPLTIGDPMSPLRWTCKSTRTPAAELTASGYPASSRLVGALLRQLRYSLQGNYKTIEGNQHPDRNAQFEHINKRVTTQMREGNPVISVDTKSQQVHYLILCMEELVVMGVDLEELLSILISDNIGNPWCKGTKSFEYLTIKGKIQEAEPGDYVDGMHIWRVTMQPWPDAFPFVVFVRAFESACKKVGCEIHDYYFTYHDIVFDHPLKLARSITNHECDPLCLSQEIIYWRATSAARSRSGVGSTPSTCSYMARRIRSARMCAG